MAHSSQNAFGVPDDVYKVPAVKAPELDDLRKISSKLDLGCKEEQLQQYLRFMKDDLLKSYQIVGDLLGPSLPVKYPRNPGYKPQPEDNLNNAWAWKCDIREAPEGKLSGKKIGIKDNIAIAGVPLMNGTRQLEGYTPDFDATVVTRILDAGGHIVGKTNCEHHCFGGTSYSSCNGPTLNPHNPLHTSGGSSSGNAVAIVNGEVDMAVGADQGGSVRFPASFSGIVALKPTWGLVPYTGAMGQDVTIDHLGLMAATVKDCALLLEVIAGYDDGKDPRQRMPMPVPEYTSQLTGDISGKIIGVMEEGFAKCQPGVNQLVRSATELLKSTGALVQSVSVPMHSEQISLTGVIAFSNFFSQFNGSFTHAKGYYPLTMIEAASKGCQSKPHQFLDAVKFGVLFGGYMDRLHGNRFYAKAQNINLQLTSAYNEALRKCDVLVMPTAPFPAPKLPLKNETLAERLHIGAGMHSNTMAFNLTGHPALSVCCGSLEGLPVGMMLVGRHFDETTVLQVAYAYEKLRDSQR